MLEAAYPLCDKIRRIQKLTTDEYKHEVEKRHELESLRRSLLDEFVNTGITNYYDIGSLISPTENLTPYSNTGSSPAIVMESIGITETEFHRLTHNRFVKTDTRSKRLIAKIERENRDKLMQDDLNTLYCEFTDAKKNFNHATLCHALCQRQIYKDKKGELLMLTSIARIAKWKKAQVFWKSTHPDDSPCKS